MRPPNDRDHQLRAPELGAAARRRRGAARRSYRTSEECGCRCSSPTSEGWTRALDKGVRDIAIFASATETFAQRNLNRSFEEQFAMFEPVVTRAREAGLRVRGYLSMCFGDPWEGDGADRPGGESRCPAHRPRLHASCPSATRSGWRRLATSSGWSRELVGAGLLRGAAGRPLPRHVRAGAVERPGRDAGRRRDARLLGGWARRVPVRRERHRKPGHRGPGLAARAGWGSRPVSTSTQLVADQSLDGRAAGQAAGQPRRERPRLGRPPLRQRDAGTFSSFAA